MKTFALENNNHYEIIRFNNDNIAEKFQNILTKNNKTLYEIEEEIEIKYIDRRNQEDRRK